MILVQDSKKKFEESLDVQGRSPGNLRTCKRHSSFVLTLLSFNWKIADTLN